MCFERGCKVAAFYSLSGFKKGKITFYRVCYHTKNTVFLVIYPNFDTRGNDTLLRLLSYIYKTECRNIDKGLCEA